MKIILTACLFFAAFAVNGQFQTPALKFKFNNSLPDGGSFYRPSILITPQQKAIVIATNQFGKVYARPKDNMPCFVPNINQIVTMPNAKRYFENSLMLNPYKKEEIIPRQ